jgi:hypothetical protein
VPPPPRAAAALAAAVVAACFACARASGSAGHSPPPAAPPAAAPPAPVRASVPRELRVPRVTGPVKIDAELEGKKLWEADVGNTRNFLDDAGRGMVPYTEAKARWGDGKLYLMLYAGDLDLEGTVREPDGDVERDDAFHIELGGPDDVRVVSVSVLGTVADARCRRTPAGRTCDRAWQSHAEVAVDRDGTLNKLGDNDEEWVVEMALPFAALGIAAPGPGTELPLSIRRCEVARAGKRACGSWGAAPPGRIVLD